MHDARIRLVSVPELVENRRVGEMQVEYLLSRGHRRLGYAYPTDPNVALIAKERLQGTFEACRRFGLEPPSVVEVELRDASTVASALEEWLRCAVPPTAICAHNDDIATMLSLAMASRQLVLGRDLAVVGVDDIPSSALAITTVRIDTQLISANVVELTLAALERREARVHDGSTLQIVARASA
jgi:DNA-binding LacI/PurR family transcriptional regulator